MHSRTLKIVLIIIGCAALLGGGFYLGSGYATETRKVVITDPNQIIDGDFSRFWAAIDLAKQKYVNIGDVKDEEILDGAISGAIAALGDPYTTYFNPEDARKFEEDLAGSFGGIGAEIGIKNDQLAIIAPLKGNPAEAAGLKAGDLILKINGTSTVGMNSDEGVRLIRGIAGTTVTLSIYREGWNDAKDFAIVRQTVVLPTVDWQMETGNIARIQLYNFNANVMPLFTNAANAALAAGAKGIVLDLRNNPGGFLDAAVDIAGWFLKPGSTVVEERLREPAEPELLKTRGAGAFSELPVVVLINGGSASASEILAGALRDNRGIKLVGEKSFGKGSVQEIQELDERAALKVSVAEWFTPNGTRIQKLGLTPDVKIELTDADIEAKRDPQLTRALELVRTEVAAR